MTVEELTNADQILHKILYALVTQITSHEGKRPGEYAANEQRTSWVNIRTQLYVEYNIF